MPASDGKSKSPRKAIDSEQELEEILSAPTARLIGAFGQIDGDMVILGAGGKMGPGLARMARRAADEAGKGIRVIGVDIFPEDKSRESLEASGVKTILCNLLAPGAIEGLPDASNIIYMVGMKFGSMENQSLTWALNAFLPGLVARRYRGSRIVVFSTGNVYPLAPADSKGANENTKPEPLGVYAQSCLAREMVFSFHSEKYSTPICIFRLNYAMELRYGVLLDIALKVWNAEPVDLTMGCFNAIWQADASERALLCLNHCKSPPMLINITGPETLSVSDVASQFGRLMDRSPVFENSPSETSLLSDASLSVEMFGEPAVSVGQAIEWIAHWVMDGKPTYGKPTHFEVRDGKF